MKNWIKRKTLGSKDDTFSLHNTLYSKASKEEEDQSRAKTKGRKPKKDIKRFYKKLDKDSSERDEKNSDPKAEEKKLQMEALSTAYDEYLKQEENLSGVLNTKTLNIKNLELKDKINYWREGKDLRNLTTEKVNEKEQEVEAVISKYAKEITVEKDLLEACKKDYAEMVAERHSLIKQENILNDFLLEIGDFKLLEIRDLVKAMERYRTKFYDEFTMLNTFVDKVSRE